MIKLLLLSQLFQRRINDLLALEIDEKKCFVFVFSLDPCL